MILDNALAHGRLLDDGFRRNLKYLKPFTRRYIFNADASHKQGRFAVDCADIVCRNTELAAKPYPNCYIEIDNIAGLKGEHHPSIDPYAAEKLGFWFTEAGHCFVLHGNEHKADFSPFIYAEKGSIAVPFGDYERFYRDDKDQKNYEKFKQHLMVGQVSEHLLADVEKFAHQMIDFYEVGLTSDSLPFEILDLEYLESIGDFKRAMSCIMLLDDRIQRRIVHVAASQKIVKGKLKAVAKHDMVTLDLDVPSIRKVYDNPIGTHATPIEHDIAEHWVHYECSSQCTHDWTQFHSADGEKRDIQQGHKEPLRREICTFCGGRRTRQLACVSGDPRKGSTVGKTRYRVIASKEKAVSDNEKL